MINKKNTALKLFCILSSGKVSKEEILKELSVSDTTFYKSLSKLKQAGFEISRTKGLYSLENYSNVILFDDVEKTALAYMANLADTYLPSFKSGIFFEFIKKFLMLSNKSDFDEVKSKYHFIKKSVLFEQYFEKIKTIEKHIEEKNNLKLTLHSGKQISIIPLKVNWLNDKTFLYYKNKKDLEEEKIPFEKIVKISKHDDDEYAVQGEETVFELYGRLAKTYLLKKNERVIKSTKDSIIIASADINKTVLFKRLLRYDTLCKILFPKKDVEEFRKIIDKSLQNIK